MFLYQEMVKYLVKILYYSDKYVASCEACNNTNNSISLAVYSHNVNSRYVYIGARKSDLQSRLVKEMRNSKLTYDSH